MGKCGTSRVKEENASEHDINMDHIHMKSINTCQGNTQDLWTVLTPRNDSKETLIPKCDS